MPDFERPPEAPPPSPAAGGLLPASRAPNPDVPARYSQEIYTADLKLKGFLPRIGVNPGVGRFFLLSVTYGTKGYRAAPPEQRERNIGLEIGLALLIFLDHFRVPYSAVGVRYDANSGRWYGPDVGNVYDHGPGM